MTTIPQVAAGLTKAQRNWLANAGYVDPNSIRSLRRKGLVDSPSRRLTADGLAVREYLINEGISHG